MDELLRVLNSNQLYRYRVSVSENEIVVDLIYDPSEEYNENVPTIQVKFSPVTGLVVLFEKENALCVEEVNCLYELLKFMGAYTDTLSSICTECSLINRSKK